MWLESDVGPSKFWREVMIGRIPSSTGPPQAASRRSVHTGYLDMARAAIAGPFEKLRSGWRLYPEFALL